MIVTPIRTRVFQEGEDLFSFCVDILGGVRERSVLVVASKIVALSENRTAVIESPYTKEMLIQSESERAVRGPYAWLTVKDGTVMASAGIDESNANGKLILLPKDSFRTAHNLRERLVEKYGVRECGVLIVDSRTVPLRAGVMGMAVGYAGFRGLKEYAGKPDIFGRPFHFSRVDVADSLAATAVLAMGEGNEQQPLALIEDAPIEFVERVSRNELLITIEDDLYRPLFFE